MFIDLFLRLLLAHVLSDFFLQNDAWCKQKLEKRFACWHCYAHAFIVFLLSWMALWTWSAWSFALCIAFSHWIIDCCKVKDGFWSFVIDQMAHLLCLICFAFMYENVWCGTMYFLPEDWNLILLYVLVFLTNAKPANILTKHILKLYSVHNPQEENGDASDYAKFQSGALIGSIERWLIIIFIFLNHYEAIGFLLAAKSIIRFRDSDTTKTEYVLAGTLISVFMAVVSALLFCSLEECWA